MFGRVLTHLLAQYALTQRGLCMQQLATYIVYFVVPGCELLMHTDGCTDSVVGVCCKLQLCCPPTCLKQ